MSPSKILWSLVIINLVATAGLGFMVLKPAEKSNASDEQMKNYISANAKHIIDSVNTYMAGEQGRGDEQTRAAIKANQDFLYAKGAHPIIGNENGDVTVVEFLDYNCGYCKKAQPIIKELVAKDKNIRVVFIEIPILAESSALAAQWALAADQMGKYEQFHDKLMEHKGPIDENVLTSFAKDVGLNAAKVKELANSQDITGQVGENLAKAREMGINGTPGFIIGDDIIRGYVELGALQASVDKARKAGGKS